MLVFFCLRRFTCEYKYSNVQDGSLNLDAMREATLPDLTHTCLCCGCFDICRFSCGSREYKYFIVQDGSLNLDAMREAAQHLVGEHDFRNFCKADVLQVRQVPPPLFFGGEGGGLIFLVKLSRGMQCIIHRPHMYPYTCSKPDPRSLAVYILEAGMQVC